MNSSVAISLMSIKQEFKTVDINCALIVPLDRFLPYFPFFYLDLSAHFQIVSVQNLQKHGDLNWLYFWLRVHTSGLLPASALP